MISKSIVQIRGFSLIELVVVILLLGVLSIFALSRFTDPDQFGAKGFYDDTLNAFRFAQKLAISTGCNVRVATATNGYQLLQSTDCTANNFANPVVNPANRGNNYENFSLPAGFKLEPETTVTFDARGIPTAAIDIAFSVSGGSTNYIFNVDGQTGLVWTN